MSESKQVAATIISQMGGAGRLKAMIGAKDFICGNDGWITDNDKSYVRFNFPMKARNGSKQFVVIYDAASDLYNIEWWKKVGMKQYDKYQANPESFRVNRMEGIYADQLKELFEQETGLYLSL